jgi:hypothetical protein
MILLTHIIFIDNNNSFSRWRNSFNSIINNIPNIPNMSTMGDHVANGIPIRATKGMSQCDLLLSGYVSERFIKLVDNIIKDNSCYKHFYVNNIGKSSVINDIIDNEIYDKYNIHIFIDSDIIFEDKQNTIDILCDLFQKSDFDVLVPNHKNDIRHNIKNIKEKYSIEGYNILYNTYYNPYNLNSFSGGLFITKRDLLKENKFDIFGIYGPDDTFFFKKLHKNNKKIGLVENLFIIHPFDSDNEYNKLKNDMLFKHLGTCI